MQASGPQLSVAQAESSRQRSGMVLEQAVTVRGMAGLLRRQLQSSTGGVVSTTVTIWLHEATAPQLSRAVHVRVIIMGHEPLVTVVTLMSVTPLLVVPAWGQQ